MLEFTPSELWSENSNAADEGHTNSINNNQLLCSDVTEALGRVPIVRLNSIHSICHSKSLYLKLEACNPGGSVKEKNAAFLVRQAVRSGLLRPGGTIVESSSGNFGVGLAMVGAAWGFNVKIVIDAKTSPTFRRILEAYGAELVEVPLSESDSHGSMQLARMERAKALAESIPNAWYVCQHLNPMNPTAHEHYTAVEIEAAFPDLPDTLVIGVSTAGQLKGIASYFRSHHPHVRIVGVDVEGSAVFGGARKPYKMTGLGLSFTPPNFHWDHLDSAYLISDQLAFSVCHALAQKEGLLLGGSTGAIVAAAIADAIQNKTGRTLIINPDSGDRYLETIYDKNWLERQNISILKDSLLQQEIESLTPFNR